MSVLAGIVLFTLIGGALSALAASLFLWVPARVRSASLPHLISFATGTLLGAAFLALLPHALETVGTGNFHGIGLTALAGILALFVLEKLVLWRHCHGDHCEAHGVSASVSASDRDAASAVMILVGDAIHNLLDGALIAAAFLTDFHLGVITAVAVFAHEIPQEVGDLAVLLNGGLGRRSALGWNLLVSLTSVVGAVLTWAWLDGARELLPYVLALAGASFIYVAAADLIPGLHRRVEASATLFQVIFIGAGVAFIFLTHRTLHL